MSKQYLAQHTIDEAHSADIFALATSPTSIITGSGHPDIKIHDTSDSSFPQTQVLKNVHPLGCHHLAISRNFTTLVSVGFSSDVKIWKLIDGTWKPAGSIDLTTSETGAKKSRSKAGELWAPALDSEGNFLVTTTYDGRNNVWQLVSEVNEKNGDVKVRAEKFAEYETRGGFGLGVDVSPDNVYTATSHPTGNIYIFSSQTTRLLHSLPTQAAPVRTIKFSPGSSLLAAAGDSCLISLYDPKSGEQVAQLRGHEAWVTSLDWSNTGEYLVSVSLDGKIKIWSVETRQCVCTMTDGEGRGLWGVKWLPRGEASVDRSKAERFVSVGNGGSIGIYREASGAS